MADRDFDVGAEAALALLANLVEQVGDGAVAEGEPVIKGGGVTCFGEVDEQLLAMGKLAIADGLIGFELVEAFGGVNFIFNDADEIVAGGVDQQVEVAPLAADFGVAEAGNGDVETVEGGDFGIAQDCDEELFEKQVAELMFFRRG